MNKIVGGITYLVCFMSHSKVINLPQVQRPWAELQACSNFTFLTGGSHPEEYMDRAAFLGLSAVAIADVNSVAGIVRAHTRGREIERLVAERQAFDHRVGLIGPPVPLGLKRSPSAQIYNMPSLLPAAKIVLRDGFTATLLPKSRLGWGRLCRLISRGRLRVEKGTCDIGFEDLLEFGGDQLILLHAPPSQKAPVVPDSWLSLARRLICRFPQDVMLLLAPVYDGQDVARFVNMAAFSHELSTPLVASAAPVMHHGSRRRLTDVLTAIRLGVQVDNLGRAAQLNSEQRLRSAAEAATLFHAYPEALMQTARILERLNFSLDDLRYEYPSELTGDETPADRLRRLAYDGLEWRYPNGASEKVKRLIGHELSLISKLEFEPYFLTVHDIVAFARSRGILCQGRGSAANSVVCYCLGVTSVSPEVGTMVFERFVSEARNEPPDIDVDFEHERREEVIQYIYARYGRHRAGLCATVVHYRGKRAIREVGRAMGLSEDTIGALSSQLWSFFSTKGEATRMVEIGLDPSDPHLRQTMDLIYEVIGFPRHLSQHVGGFIVTDGRLDELVPIENATMEGRTVICWDKDDINSLGILKVDILALGMLTCIRKAFDLIAVHHGVNYSLATLPPEDPAVYDMICQADTLGVFQVESRAQMNFLPRMRPRTFYDLVIEVAIIRPGPIQGDMVHPYIRRRNGEEAVSFPSDALGAVLGKTLGVPLFQEQAMQIAIVGAGFTPDQADRLRRSLATFKKHGNVSEFQSLFMRGMLRNGYEEEFSARCFAQIEGFGAYGFPESHAASFALLVYASSWLKYHHPGIFACALLNSQPMGFYAPAQIVRDARTHGVPVRPICINASYWDNVIEPDGTGGLAIRLGFRQIKSMSEDEVAWLTAARGNGYRDVEAVWQKAGLSPKMIQALAEADAFKGLGLSRRTALWASKGITADRPLPLFSQDLGGEGIVEAQVHLPEMTEGEEVIEDYVSMRLTLRSHPVALIRHRLTPGMGHAPAVPVGLESVSRRPDTENYSLQRRLQSANIINP